MAKDQSDSRLYNVIEKCVDNTLNQDTVTNRDTKSKRVIFLSIIILILIIITVESSANLYTAIIKNPLNRSVNELFKSIVNTTMFNYSNTKPAAFNSTE